MGSFKLWEKKVSVFSHAYPKYAVAAQPNSTTTQYTGVASKVTPNTDFTYFKVLLGASYYINVLNGK